jgi:2Fe-2S ferredoxin
MYTINFSFEQKGLASVTLKRIESGYTLLELALKNDIALRHDCGGICACTTCHVYVEKGMEFLERVSKREKDFIPVTVNPRTNSRMGCQSLLREGKGTIDVIIPDQAQVRDKRKEV